MNEEKLWDKEKGRLTILGHRHVAIDAQALCDHLDSLLGSQVAQVVMNNHEFRLGKEDAERVRRENPQATIQEIIDQLEEADLISGVGIVNVKLPLDHANSTEVTVEVSDPCVKRTEGASKAFICSYWSGVMSALLGGECEPTNLTYRGDKNILSYRIVRRSARNTRQAQA
jgi:hypothetical protein